MTSKSRAVSAVRLRLVLRCACLTAIAVALLFGGAGNCLASGSYIDFTWIAGSGNWDTGANWQTNFYSYHDTILNTDACRITNFVNEVRSNVLDCVGGGTGTRPDTSGFQSSFFTNAGTYTITFSSTAVTASNVFANATNTEANVTMDMSTMSGTELLCFEPFIVAAKAGSTTTVTLVTGTKKLHLNEGMVVGGSGYGTLFFNSGTIDTTKPIVLGNGDGGRGKLVVSGPNTWVKPATHLEIGKSPQQDPAGSMLIISNGAHVEFPTGFRLGSSPSKGGSSNNLMVITNATLTCDTGPISIGLRSTGVTNSLIDSENSGGTLNYNNVAIVKNGGLWVCAITSTRSFVIGDAAWFGSIGTQTCTASPPASSTGNTLRIEAGGVVTGISGLFIGPTNNLDLFGGFLKAGTISNWGIVKGYGTHRGEQRHFSNATLRTLNSQGPLIISNGLWMVTNSILEVECGTAATNPTQIYFGGEYTGSGPARGGTNRFEIDGATLNIVATSGFGNTNAYDLFTYATTPPSGGWGSWSVDATNALGITNFTGFVIGTTPNPSYTYTIDTNTLGVIRLLIGCTTPFQIVSVARSANDIVIKWTETVGSSNIVQSTTGSGGNYSTNAFADIAGSGVTTPASGTNIYTHTGGATGSATRYYRIRRVP